MVAAGDTSSIDFSSPNGQLLAKGDSSISSSPSSVGTNGKNIAPRLQQLRRWLDDPASKKKLLYWAAVVTGTLQLGIKIASLIVFCTVGDDETPPKATWIIFISINILFLTLILLVYFGRFYYYRHGKYTGQYFSTRNREDTEKLIKPNRLDVPKRSTYWSFLSRAEFLLNIVMSTFIVITSVIFLANASSHILTLPDYSTRAAIAVGFEGTDCALAVIFFIFDVLFECFSFAMVAQALALVTSVLNLLVTVVCIWANEGPRILGSNLSSDDVTDMDTILGHVRAFSYFGIIIAFCSGIGFVTSMSIDAHNRLSDIGTTLSSTYLLANIAALVISIVYFGMSLHNLTVYLTYDQWALRNVLIADVCSASANMLLSVFGIMAMLKVRQRPMTDLQVEEYDLSKLSNDQLAVWIRLIDTYNKQESKNPDAAAGYEALSLFRAYANNPMPHMKCRVLRVFDNGSKAYDKIRAWDSLDHNEVFESDDASIIDNKESVINKPKEDKKGNGNGTSNVTGGNGQAMSKNAAKRAKLKAAKKAAKQGGSDANINAAGAVHAQLQQSPEEIRRDIKFRNDLIATEALVLLTSIENYDLLSSVSGTWYGKLAAKLIGAQSPFKWTCIRMGLLATHWPFRQSMLFTSHTRKPNARAAAVCRAIAYYNCQLPSSKRCAMILNPTVAHRGMEQALKPSGWLSVPLPPSHVVDLRPYKNYTLQEYLKKIKYRDQSKAFERAHGEVIETTDFNQAYCKKAIELWWNIASKRTADGNTSVLANPTVELLETLGSVCNDKGSRSLLFLKVDGKVIASAVLFRLGDTITSDIQGLDHDLARKYNAYFVMMQETIKIALTTGLKFVDFGPTTSQPKMAIGSREVEIYGGIFVRAPLSWFVTIFSGNVQVDEG